MRETHSRPSARPDVHHQRDRPDVENCWQGEFRVVACEADYWELVRSMDGWMGKGGDMGGVYIVVGPNWNVDSFPSPASDP